MSSLRLSDIQGASPEETHEEGTLLQSFEGTDPTGRSIRHFDSLLELPDVDETAQQRIVGPETVEEELFEFTNSINKIDYETRADDKQREHTTTGNSEDSFPVPPAQIFHDESRARTHADTFAAHAGKIYHRFQKKKNRQQQNRHGRPALQRSTDRVTFKGKSPKEKKRLRKYFALDALNDFRDTVVSRRDRTLAFCKNSILFVILPATAIACLLFYVFDNPGPGEDSVGLIDRVNDFIDPGTKIPTMAPTAMPTVVNASLPMVNLTSPTSSPSSAEQFTAVVSDAVSSAKGGNSTGADSTFANDDEEEFASYSWWVLFLFVRQVVTFGLARAGQFLVGYSALSFPGFTAVASFVRVFFLQAKGWPLQLFLWAVLDYAMLYGDRDFARHWLFFQDYLNVFNDSNPAGSVTTNKSFRGALIFSLCLSSAVAVKRFWIGLRFGRASYYRYAEKLALLLKRVLLVSKLAQFAHRRDFSGDSMPSSSIWLEDDQDAPELKRGKSETPKTESSAIVLGQQNVTIMSLSDTDAQMIAELLGEWEEIEIADKPDQEGRMSAIVQFRASLSILDSGVPFSTAFGMAKTRRQVLAGSERLYETLVRKQSSLHDTESNRTTLLFHTIALTALQDDGELNRPLAKNLMMLFRPSREGDLSLVDFCKSIDNLYKELRMLRANIANEARLNAASEKIFNVVFYFVMIMIGLAAVGIDPWALFSLMSSFVLGFSFMISGASSDYFRGLLFILAQRPYDIGDRIAIAHSESDACTTGSPGWLVKDVSLYHTTIVYGTTQEYATISNGKLSQSRIINCARSPRAQVNFTLKFGINVSSTTVEDFKQQLMDYVKSKPREWFAFAAFRMTSMEANQGYVEYIAFIQHRESWQQIGAVLNSLADAQTFAFEMSKQMGMGYQSPSLPVDLRTTNVNFPGAS